MDSRKWAFATDKRRLRKISAGLGIGMMLTLAVPASASAPMPKVALPLIKMTPKLWAQIELAKRGEGFSDFKCLEALWQKESGWNHLADNPTSSAFGIAQRLGETSKSPRKQIHLGVKYVFHRYNGSCHALAHFSRHFWY
jgi:hypothetical protein